MFNKRFIMNIKRNQGNDHKVAGTQVFSTTENGKFNFKYGNQITFDEIAEFIGGYVEMFHIGNKMVWCDEEGILKKLPVNKAATEYAYSLVPSGKIEPGWCLYGNVVFCDENDYLDGWEHMAQKYYPEDLEDITVGEGEDADFESEQELSESVLYEIECLLADWDPAIGYKYAYNPRDWFEAKETVEQYIDVLTDNGCEVPEWVYNTIAEREKLYTA